MKKASIALLGGALLVTLAGTVQAQQALDHVTCRAGTVTVLAKDKDMIIWSLDHRGVNYSSDPSYPFNGSTQRCIGVVANIGGKPSGNGWCRTVDAKSGDWNIADWQVGDKPGHGTWHFRYGTGGGTFEPVAPTKSVDPGTYQNCTHIKGTVKLQG